MGRFVVMVATSLATIVACGSTYGDEQTPATTSDAGPGITSSSSSTSSTSSSSSSSSGSAEPSDAAIPPARDAATASGCPLCADDACYASGCGGGKPATCAAPPKLGAGSYSVIVCPEASTAKSCGKDGPAMLPAAAFSLGGGSWSIEAKGSNAVLTYGTCAQYMKCAGGASGGKLDAAGPTTITVSVVDLTACEEVLLLLSK